MRTLSWISRAFAVGAAIVATSIIVGGSYFVGFVSEVQRGLNDPESASQQASESISSMEQMLGYDGYLKAYRAFRLTGDTSAREQMKQRAMESARTLDMLRKLYINTPAATGSIADIASVFEEFSRVARAAPDMGPAALRGTPSMEALDSLPNVPQLETTYLTLRTALERLRSQTQSHQMGSIAWILSWSQMLVICALALLAFGLMAAAGLLQLGITQPLKSLARSLTSVGDGHVNQPVWGTDRPDEIGTMARAGEKLRQSLTETESLKALAQKGEVHVRLEGDASILFEKLASGVSDAADALKAATTEIIGNQASQQSQIQSSIDKLDAFAPKFDQMAHAIARTAKDAISGAASELHASMSKVVDTADERNQRLNQIAGQFEQSGRHLSDAVDLVRGKTGNAIDGITSSITAFRKAADGAQSIQGAFFEACDRISSDASATADNIKLLADRLGHVADSVDGQLTSKIEALGRLEGGIESTLGSIEQRTRETTDAIATAAAAMEHRTSKTEQRTEKSIDDFEAIVGLFRDQHGEAIKSLDHGTFAQAIERLNEISERLQSRFEQAPTGKQQDVEALTRALSRRIDISLNSLSAQANQSAAVLSSTAAAVEQRASDSEKNVERSLAEFHDLLKLFRDGHTPATTEEAAPGPQMRIEEIVAPITRQIETLRNDVRELAMRMTEERIMMTADMPASKLQPEAQITFTHPQRSLSDVPVNELLNRIKDLQDEMNAPAPSTESSTEDNLASALSAFSESLRPVLTTRDPLKDLKGLLPDLARYADVIEQRAHEVKPTAAALRTELGAITSELRAMTRNVEAADPAHAEILRETALNLGARAESLFSYLSQTHPEDFRAQPAIPASETASFAQTADDLDTLARIIGKLEQRTATLSDEAIIANIAHQVTSPSPTERKSSSPRGADYGDKAIATVFEAIERLNSIAAALARASDANEQHRAAI